MLSNIARRSPIKAGCLVAFGLLTTSISAAARDGVMPYDTLVCRDKGIIMGFADQMRRTTPDEFFDYVGNLIHDGRCDKILEGERVTFTELPDGRSCVSVRPNEPCYWSGATAERLVARAIAARTPPTTTGQGAASETTGSAGLRPRTGETTTTTRTTTTIIRPGERPVTTTETTRTTR